jgi:hypothetical protein
VKTNLSCSKSRPDDAASFEQASASKRLPDLCDGVRSEITEATHHRGEGEAPAEPTKLQACVSETEDFHGSAGASPAPAAARGSNAAFFVSRVNFLPKQPKENRMRFNIRKKKEKKSTFDLDMIFLG